MASDSTTAALLDLVPEVLGPVVVAVSFNAFLYGICTLQFARYIVVQHDDTWSIRGLVWWSYSLDTAHSATIVYLLWFYTVQNFNDLDVLTSAPWPFTATPIFSILISCPVQLFFAWRVKQFSGSWPLYIGIAGLAISSAVIGLASAIFGVLNPGIQHFDKNSSLIYSWLATAMGCDTAIAGFMLHYLNKSRTGFKKTDTVITRLIHYSVETTIISAIFCLLEVAMFAYNSNATYYTLFAIPLGRLYTNTILVILNSRRSLRAELHGDGQTSLTGAAAAWDHGLNRRLDFTPHYQAAEVKVAVDQQIRMDAYAVRPSSRNSNVKADASESDAGYEGSYPKATLGV